MPRRCQMRQMWKIFDIIHPESPGIILSFRSFGKNLTHWDHWQKNTNKWLETVVEVVFWSFSSLHWMEMLRRHHAQQLRAQKRARRMSDTSFLTLNCPILIFRFRRSFLKKSTRIRLCCSMAWTLSCTGWHQRWACSVGLLRCPRENSQYHLTVTSPQIFIFTDDWTEEIGVRNYTWFHAGGFRKNWRQFMEEGFLGIVRDRWDTW